MNLELIAGIASTVLSAVVALVGWSVRSTVSALRTEIAGVREQVGRVEGHVQQLAAQGARHGESLAAGVQEFKDIGRRLDRLENMVFGGGPSPSGLHAIVRPGSQG